MHVDGLFWRRKGRSGITPRLAVCIGFVVRFRYPSNQHRDEPMPIQIKYSDDGLGAFYIGSGVVTGHDVMAADDILYQSEERFTSLRYQLVDLTKVESVDASAIDMEIIIRKGNIAAKANPNIVIAVAGDQDIAFGLSRMWEALAESGGGSFRATVVRSIPVAVDWIKEQIGQEVSYPN
jgi:hypothetical protein